MVTMRDDRTHPLLAQVPLTVSPFVTLPAAATLPYTYRSMPSTLPPPASGVTGPAASASSDDGSSSHQYQHQYVVSPSGHAAHPDAIAASCVALQEHVARARADAERELARLDERARARELAERRRVAPGWLDSEARLLEPERPAGGGGGEQLTDVAGALAEMSISDGDNNNNAPREGASEMAVDQGAELDRAFGGK
ncbi:hypothetical protein GGR56DRAFT_89166 [Xylariaceae sp. FL0804]|nr:hypothetical protein GGR56DRAFT_89166 [Xylariaceae sp. FL0804]